MFTRHDTETRRSLQNSASCAFERARMVLADRHEHQFGRGPPLRPPGRRDAACGGETAGCADPAGGRDEDDGQIEAAQMIGDCLA